MTTSQDQALVTDIETTVRNTPGVTAIFRAGGIVSKMVDVGAQVLRIQDEGAPLITFEQSPEGAHVEVAIGVRSSAGAVGTSRRVHTAISALCAARHVTPAQIHITVVHVDDSTEAKGTSW